MKINGIDIKEIWEQIEHFGIKKMDLEGINLDDGSLYQLYLTAISDNNEKFSRKNLKNISLAGSEILKNE